MSLAIQQTKEELSMKQKEIHGCKWQQDHTDLPTTHICLQNTNNNHPPTTTINLFSQRRIEPRETHSLMG